MTAGGALARARTATLSLLLVWLGACVHRIEAPRAFPARESLLGCNPGECVEDAFELPRWAHTERLRGRMPYHTDPGGQLDGDRDPEVTRVILAIHGIYGEGERGFKSVETPPGLLAWRAVHSALLRAEAQDPALDRRSIAVLAPTFQFADQWEPYSEDDPRYWRWGRGAWSGGNLSAAAPDSGLGGPDNDRVSSHEVLDGMLQMVTVKYPNVETIVVVGHSLGAQTVHRFALLGTGNHELLERAGVHVRYVVGNPGCYTYLWPERKLPAGGGQLRLDTPGADTRSWRWRRPKGCDDYDEFHLGLADYGSNPRAAAAAAYLLGEYLPGLDRSAWRQIRREPGSKLEHEWARKLFNYQYSRRDIWHLQAEDDTAPGGPSCGWAQQGRSRAERWRHFAEAWKRFTLWESDSVQFIAVPGLSGARAHSSVALYGSEAGIRALFH